jgi:hypothetical protein
VFATFVNSKKNLGHNEMVGSMYILYRTKISMAWENFIKTLTNSNMGKIDGKPKIIPNVFPSSLTYSYVSLR